MKADVAIVGGGPAGTAAAICLAREGFDVALFDRATFPRDKPCGEFLNPAAAQLVVNELRIELPEDAAPMRHVSLIPSSGSPLEVQLLDSAGNPAVGYSLPRIRLDLLLLEAARREGVQVFEGHSVRHLHPGGLLAGRDSLGSPFECTTRVAIAADGTHSILARERGLVRPVPRLQRIGFVAHFAGVTGKRADAVQMFGARPGGCGVAGFAAQAGDNAVLSAVVPRSSGREVSADRTGFAWKLVRSLPGLASVLATARLEDIHATPCFGHALDRPFDDGLLFAGDAARFVDPFTGEGIHHALLCGILASQTAIEHLHHGQPLSSYTEARKELENRYRVCDLIQAVVHRPWLLERLTKNLARRPKAAEALFGALVDLLPPRTVWSPRTLAAALLPLVPERP